MVLLLPQAGQLGRHYESMVHFRMWMFNSSKVENPEWYPELRTGAPLKDMIRRDDARMRARVALRLWTFGLLTSSHHLI